MVTFISLIPDEESTMNLRDYIAENISPISKPKIDFHSTILYSPGRPVFKRQDIQRAIEGRLPVVIDGPLQLEVFGQGELVLRYESPVVRKMNNDLLNEGARQKDDGWSDLVGGEREILDRARSEGSPGSLYFFNPHITIARDFPEEGLKYLAKFRKGVTLKTLFWEQKFIDEITEIE